MLSGFKPRNAINIEYANERRPKDKIADRFVYQSVKMVCQNFGLPIKKEGSTKNTKKYLAYYLPLIFCSSIYYNYRNKTEVHIFSTLKKQPHVNIFVVVTKYY